MDPVLRLLTTIPSSFAAVCLIAHAVYALDTGMIESGGTVSQASHVSVAHCQQAGSDSWCFDGYHSAPCRSHCSNLHSADNWQRSVRVGYDNGFVIASQRELDLNTGNFPFLLKINGWGQLRHTISDLRSPNRDLNEFQLKRGRIVFSGSAFNPNFFYFVQLDGRSSSGDDVRLLDYYFNYDLGNELFGLKQGTFGVRAGKYKVPFTMSRWLSGRDFEFTDRSLASIYFDVNRSFAWGLYGETKRLPVPINWEIALFNGLVTGGAETGSAGTLDDNFAFSTRLFAYPIGDWGDANLHDFRVHQQLAMRTGIGFATTEIDRVGTTEFNSLRVVDSGSRLADILPPLVTKYGVSLFCADASFKFRGWSSTIEYYFRNVSDFRGQSIPDLYDHGLWLQLGKFIIPRKLQLAARWSRVVGDSGTLGVTRQSSDEISGALGWYFRENHAKVVFDVTKLDGAPINSSALDISPGDNGWLYRSQIQFSF